MSAMKQYALDVREHYIDALNELVFEDEEGALIPEESIVEAALARDLLSLQDHPSLATDLDDWPAALAFIAKVLKRHGITAPVSVDTYMTADEYSDAREDLGPEATTDEVENLVAQRATVAFNEFEAPRG